MKRLLLFFYLISSCCAPLFSQWEKVLDFQRFGTGDIHFFDQENGMAVGHYSKGILRTADGGNTWIFEEKVFNETFDKLFFANADTGMAVGEYNRLFITMDGGKTYQKESWNPPKRSDFSSGRFHMISRNRVFSVGEYARIYLTTNGGKQWDTIRLTPYTNTLLDITCIGTDTCYACGSVGLIAVSYDSGKTWASQQLSINNDLNELYFRNSKEGFAGGARGVLIKTMDGGNTWDILNTGCKNDIEKIYFFNADSGYLVSDYGGLLRTSNGGDSWEIYKPRYALSTSVVEKAFFNGSDTVFAFTHSWIVKVSLNQDYIPVALARQYKSEEFYIWPNPVNRILHLENFPSIGNICIYDLQGKELIHQNNTSTIDMGYLKAGMYIIKIQTNNKAISYKFLKM